MAKTVNREVALAGAWVNEPPGLAEHDQFKRGEDGMVYDHSDHDIHTAKGEQRGRRSTRDLKHEYEELDEEASHKERLEKQLENVNKKDREEKYCFVWRDVLWQDLCPRKRTGSG
jgi:hypothetical protein